MTERHRARKRFGQHFLHDPGVIDQLMRAIQPREEETLVEIGPGPGALTLPLSQSRSRALHLIEIDRDLVGKLRTQFGTTPHVTIHQADALRFDFASLGTALRIAGNLPYNISTPLLFRLLESRRNIIDMHFMLQKEVVDRITAEPGSKRYGRLTIMLGCSLSAEHLFDVPASAFTPEPKVVSSVVRLAPRRAEEEPSVDMDALNKLVAHAFTKRRKTLHNALKGKATDEAMKSVGIDPTLRPENIPIDAWVALTNALDDFPVR